MEILKKIIPYFFLLYFLILFAERVQSLVRAFADTETPPFGTGFDVYVNLLAAASLAATLVLLFARNADFLHALIGGTPVNYAALSLTAGVLLVSGMVHTEHTIPAVQFIAYGMLIVAMILHTVISVRETGDAFCRYYSLVYLTVFSMAIPVVYRSHIAAATLFHIVEAVVSLALVAVFTWLLMRMFSGRGADLLFYTPIVLAAVGDVAVLLLRWREEVNTFVLIFAVGAVFLFALGKILFRALR